MLPSLTSYLFSSLLFFPPLVSVFVLSSPFLIWLASHSNFSSHLLSPPFLILFPYLPSFLPSLLSSVFLPSSLLPFISTAILLYFLSQTVAKYLQKTGDTVSDRCWHSDRGAYALKAAQMSTDLMKKIPRRVQHHLHAGLL